MKRLIIYFLIILGAIWLGVIVARNPGYILIMYHQWAIETTVWFVVLTLFIVLFSLYWLLKLLRNITHLPDTIETWWQERRERKSIKLQGRGYCDLVTGKFKTAEKKLLQGAQNETLAFVNYMIAATAANSRHAIPKRDQYLLQAKKSSPQNSYVVDISHIQFLLKNNQPEEALAAITTLRQERPKEPVLLKLLAEAYVQLHDWFHLQIILKDLKKQKILDEAHFLALEKETYLNSLKDHYFPDFSELQQLWNKIPKHLRHDPAILKAYAAHLIRWNKSNEAEELIRKELKKQFSSELMEYYVTTRSSQPAKQVALGEKYLKQHTEDASLLRAMGILCLHNKLWGQARDYLENSLMMQPTAETYSALGYTYEKLGESERALRYYRKGLSYLTPF